jgi:hypothetical protein
MVNFVGLDVSVKATSVCVVDDAGKVILEEKVPTGLQFMNFSRFSAKPTFDNEPIGG